jgi:hypothetical protein
MNNIPNDRMANKYQDDPWSMHRLNKHFYSENVFVDSNSDRPIIRRRNRNFFVDDVAYGQRTHDSDSHNVSHVDSDVKRADVESKKVPVSAMTKYSYLNTGMTTLLAFGVIISQE